MFAADPPHTCSKHQHFGILNLDHEAVPVLTHFSPHPECQQTQELRSSACTPQNRCRYRKVEQVCFAGPFSKYSVIMEKASVNSNSWKTCKKSCLFTLCHDVLESWLDRWPILLLVYTAFFPSFNRFHKLVPMLRTALMLSGWGNSSSLPLKVFTMGELTTTLAGRSFQTLMTRNRNRTNFPGRLLLHPLHMVAIWIRRVSRYRRMYGRACFLRRSS